MRTNGIAKPLYHSRRKAPASRPGLQRAVARSGSLAFNVTLDILISAQAGYANQFGEFALRQSPPPSNPRAKNKLPARPAGNARADRPRNALAIA
jgi:hypothetical protein